MLWPRSCNHSPHFLHGATSVQHYRHWLTRRNRSTLQRHNGIISSKLEGISALLSEHHDLLSSLSVYPLPQFPGPSQGHILESLLRSKLEPDVEDWVEQGEAVAPSRSATATRVLSINDLNDLWRWAKPAARKMEWQQCWGGDYTLAERLQGLDQGWETIETGIERELEDPGTPKDPNAKDVEEDEEDEGGMEVDEPKQTTSSIGPRIQQVPPLSLEKAQRFMSTGKIG